jgi:uncharacterized protein YwqG
VDCRFTFGLRLSAGVGAAGVAGLSLPQQGQHLDQPLDTSGFPCGVAEREANTTRTRAEADQAAAERRAEEDRATVERLRDELDKQRADFHQELTKERQEAAEERAALHREASEQLNTLLTRFNQSGGQDEAENQQARHGPRERRTGGLPRYL